MPPLPPTSSSTTTMDGSPSKASTVKWTLGQERREEQQQPAGGGLEREISTGATGATTITTTTKALSPVSFSQAIPSQGGGGGKEKAWRQMLRFVDVLAEQGMLNGDDVVALREGILHDRRVLLSGYEVAEYHRSAELLAVLWKATARSLLTDRGRKLVIFAQEHILEVLDLLLQTERITADQHIHLVRTAKEVKGICNSERPDVDRVWLFSMVAATHVSDPAPGHRGPLRALHQQY